MHFLRKGKMMNKNRNKKENESPKVKQLRRLIETKLTQKDVKPNLKYLGR